jgi:hypothetical protein
MQLSDKDDPEAAMQRDFERKREFLTKESQVAREEFIEQFKADFGVVPDFTKPIMSAFFNAWIAAQGERQWLTEDDKIFLKARQKQNEQRRATMKRKKQESAEVSKQRAAERKKLADKLGKESAYGTGR